MHPLRVPPLHLPTVAKGSYGWCTKGNGPPLPPCTPAFLSRWFAPSPNSILHAFLGLTSSRLHSTFFFFPCLHFFPLLWPPLLSPLNPSSPFFFINFIFSPVFNSQHSLPRFSSPSLSLLLPVAVFSVLPVICNLWMDPVLLSLSGPSASLRGSCSLGLRGVMPGWGISLLPYFLLSFLSLFTL